jgi:hypothetical protein
MVTKGLFFQFCDIENFAQISPPKKNSKISQLYTRKNHIFPENFPTFGRKFDKICPKKSLMCMPVYACGFLLCFWGLAVGILFFKTPPIFCFVFPMIPAECHAKTKSEENFTYGQA